MRVEYQTNGQPYYINFEDLREKLGYKVYKPKIGNFGRALIKASQEGNHRSVGWLKRQLDELFRKKRQTERQQRGNLNGNKKQNIRLDIQSNGYNNI